MRLFIFNHSFKVVIKIYPLNLS
ncbi:conserved protein of unknown function [Ectopseudomonas oleovorans]|uniref:Uncharacterized protein n=1 Tax=Ectopseudomonas oleovorans TaxID=301 RepID=A0A653BCI8_ECTOL|nr:conserved protein of unknown function [Pseudomonas oleovorans]